MSTYYFVKHIDASNCYITPSCCLQ